MLSCKSLSIAAAAILFAFWAVPLLVLNGMQTSVINVAAGADLQTALNSAHAGDTLVLQSGATYATVGSFTITSGVTIRSSVMPAESRINPASVSLAKIISTGGYPVITTIADAHDIVLSGIEITTGGGRYTPDLVNISGRNITVDRCFIHPFEVVAANLFPATVARTSGRGIAFSGSNITIKWNWIGGFAGKFPASDAEAGHSIDSYGVYSPSGLSDPHIIDNYISAQFNNIFLGGSDDSTPNFATVTNATISSATFSNTANLAVGDLVAMQSSTSTPKPWETGRVTAINGTAVSFTLLKGQYASAAVAPNEGGQARWNGDIIHNVEIRGNFLDKPDVWNAFSNPKAWIEIKACDGCLIDGNDMYSGVGTTIAFTARNQNGSAPWTTIRNVTFSNNRMVGFKWGMGIATLDNEQPNSVGGNFLISNNLWDRPLVVDQTPQFLQIYDGNGIVVRHNTVNTDGPALFSGNGNIINGLVLTDNVMSSGYYGFNCFNSDGKCWPGLVMTLNAIIDTRGDKQSSLASIYPGNYYPATRAAAGLKGTDGKDVGVDMVALNLALGGAITAPTPSPTVSTPSPTPSASATATPQTSPIPTPVPSPITDSDTIPVPISVVQDCSASDPQCVQAYKDLSQKGYVCFVNSGKIYCRLR